ncbi:nuclear transport factor 2 family protein [Carboxylicivirga caseinilyticus]|uniref:nuclear transport factor 2 family protein n=1 Tax=Carboxylicivirga caseinilyticus TaxID=3417572 RepID=UPI003D345D7F|nr:nuclear transport factor 2 family protein [Marinilabiliaceae bacterium A049]
MNTLNAQIRDSEKVAPIKDTLSRMLRAQEEGDLYTFATTFAHNSDLVNIGTDLDEIWYGWKDFYSWMEAAITDRKGYTITAKDTHISLSQSGDVAWYSQLLDTCYETKGEPFNLEGFRHTGVMEKRDSKWVIVQSHVSAPYKNNAQHPLD